MKTIEILGGMSWESVAVYHQAPRPGGAVNRVSNRYL